MRHSFFAYDPPFTVGVRVGAADVDGDGLVDLLTAVGGGAGSHVRAFSGLTLDQLESFFAFVPGFSGGIFIG